ncbi:nectin-2-like isoform X2 [Parambassis ranga]|nr:nectin-2-like isoform X2 [Parambassis ranga]XP_028282186.1 nectin-2-like isoform X2 [Parambassis ranga]
MKTSSTSCLLLLKLMYLVLLSVSEAQRVEVLPEVTGYLGQDVTLPCAFQGPQSATVTQVQWNLLQTGVNTTALGVFNVQHGVFYPDSPLKGRLNITEQSLIIKNLELTDEGLYGCNIATFPSGSLEGSTRLNVRAQMPLSTGTVSTIVTVVVLLLAIMAATAYLLFIRRHNSSSTHRVFIDTAGAAIDVARPSVIIREEVVYSDVKLKPSRDVTASSGRKCTVLADDDVTYAEVVVRPVVNNSSTADFYV